MNLENFKYETAAVLVLDELGTNEIPKEIGQLTHAESIIVHATRPEGNIQLYPPVSWYERRELKPPFRTLPKEIGQLKNLKTLRLIHLDIHELPTNLSQLESLEYLDLSLNKLDLTQELPKLRGLPNLKHLAVWGNHFDEAQMQQFQADLPNVKLEYKSEEDSRLE
ncbi:MAG: hypothetical protein AAF944_00495 [Bacteroidota bacterium]